MNGNLSSHKGNIQFVEKSHNILDQNILGFIESVCENRKKQKQELRTMCDKTKRQSGAGRKINFPDLVKKVLTWMRDCRSNDCYRKSIKARGITFAEASSKSNVLSKLQLVVVFHEEE